MFLIRLRLKFYIISKGIHSKIEDFAPSLWTQEIYTLCNPKWVCYFQVIQRVYIYNSTPWAISIEAPGLRSRNEIFLHDHLTAAAIHHPLNMTSHRKILLGVPGQPSYYGFQEHHCWMKLYPGKQKCFSESSKVGHNLAPDKQCFHLN